jgi:hypothetical protein
MITSKQIIKLSEEYAAMGKSQGYQVEIYKNPASSDLSALVKFAKEHNRQLRKVRFVADAKTKTVYVADAYLIEHNDIRKIVGLPTYPTRNDSWVLDGIADYVSGKLNLITCSPTVGNFSFSWEFVDRYVPGVSVRMKQTQDKNFGAEF